MGASAAPTIAMKPLLLSGPLSTFLDADGYLYVTARAKEVINRGGETISPVEIEECLVSHPLVHEVAAFSTPHATLQEAVGVCVVPVPVDASTNFQPTPDLLEEADARDPARPIKGVIVASPSNPTGTVLTERELFALHDWCAGYGRKSKTKAWFVSDEIYHGLSHGEPAPTALQFDPNAIVINSFSKFIIFNEFNYAYKVILFCPWRKRHPCWSYINTKFLRNLYRII